LAELLIKDECYLEPEHPKPRVKGQVKFMDGPRFAEDVKA